MNITWVGTTFYTKAKRALPPLGLVIHDTETDVAATPSAGGSWHYQINRAGAVTHYVQDWDLAWHVRACDEWRPSWMQHRDTRVSEPNSCCLGVELVSSAKWRASGIPYTDAQYAALHDLLADLYGIYGPLPIVTHGSLQLDRTDPVNLDVSRAGLVWHGDGYRYEGAEDMARIHELETALASLNGINRELQSQVDALHEEVTTRTAERDALQEEVAQRDVRLALCEQRVKDVTEAAAAVQQPTRVEVLVGDDRRLVFVPAV